MPRRMAFLVQPLEVTGGMPLREDAFVHLHYSISGETRLSHVFPKKKTTEVVFKLCVALLHSDHLRPDAFLSVRGTVRVTTEVVNFIDKNQAV